MRFAAAVMYFIQSIDVEMVAKYKSKSSAPAIMRNGSHVRGVTATVTVLLSSALMMAGCSGKGSFVAAVNTLPTSTPLFSTTNPGSYTSMQQVSLVDTTPGAVIYYTTDGVTQPTAVASEQYSGAITVSSTETITALAVAPGYSNSTILSGTYTINQGPAATPTFSTTNPPGQYTSAQQVTLIDTTPGAVIYYTTDGVTQPTAVASEQYSGTITVSSTETIKAIAVAPGYSNSTILSGTYNISAPTSVMSGRAYSGSNPIVGATVNLYSTGNTGYGSMATLLATTSTDTNGNFTLPANTCVAGSQVYVTTNGGNAGSGVNPDYILMAVLGSCSTISSTTKIWMNEASTVAAAYALRPFISISGTTVNIGAPAANNSSTPSCTGTGASMICTAAGLAHAFLNATALVSDVSLTGTPSATGTAHTVSPYNSSASVPAAVINSLANVVEACVNSTGIAAGSMSACVSLFSSATPPGGTAPANTLQALMNIAQYPTQNVAGIFALATPVMAYAPALTVAPPDWSLALVYSGVTVGTTTTPFAGGHALALDASDNVYALSSTAANNLLTGMTSNGEGIFTYTDTTYLLPKVLATDTLGNLFFSNSATTATDADVVEVSNGGAFEQAIAIGAPYYAYGVAVDRYNNVYASNEYTASHDPTVYIIPPTSSTATAATVGTTKNNQVEVVVGSYPHSLSIDPSGDVWAVADTTGVSSTTLLSNSADGLSTPSFSSLAKVTESATLSNGYNATFDSSGNAWVNNYTMLFEIPVTAKSQNTTAVTPASVAAAPSQSIPITGLTGSGATATSVAVTYSATDGANNIFLVDYTGKYLWRFVPASSGGTFIALQPCAAPNGQTTCNAGTTAGTYPAIYTPIAIALDATGAIWIPGANSDTVAQVLGLAAPVWPQLSYGHPGVSPQ